MSLTTRVLVALLAGFALGAAAAASSSPALHALGAAMRPLGALWVNAVFMTVVPLVVASLIVTVNSVADSRLVGAVGWRAVLLLALLLFAGAALAALVAPPLVAWLPVDPASAEALRNSFAASTPTTPSPPPPTLAQWVAGLMPRNALEAAANGTMLPLVVFSLTFALALGRVAPGPRETALRFFEAVRQAMLVILGWVIRAAPLGVFALATALGTEAAAAVGAIAYYVLFAASLCLLATGLLYLVATLGGRVPLVRFARAAAPAQAMAASTRSSLAALPVMVKAADEELALPPVVGGAFLPFAVAAFKFTSPLAYIGAACFLGRVFGIELDSARLAALVPLSVAMSLGVPGVPGGWFTAAPVFAAAGLPAEAIGILMAVDAVPDIFRTLGNVTADLAAGALVARTARHGEVAAPVAERGVATAAAP